MCLVVIMVFNVSCGCLPIDRCSGACGGMLRYGGSIDDDVDGEIVVIMVMWRWCC